MNHLTADESMCDHLRGVLEPVEIRDAQGKLLGHYTPFVSPEERALYEKVRNSLNLDELKALRETARGPGKPLAEIIRRLEAGEQTG
jgi:hypothetical protein